MSIRYNPKISTLIQKKVSSFNKKNRFDKKNLKTPSSSSNNTWTRPSDWLTMPTITSSDQKVALLVSVFDNDSNFIALLCSGNYTVDWGDGVTENINAGVKAQHIYTYSTLSSVVSTNGYKMAIVTITPQSGQNLTSVNLNQLYTGLSVQLPILEIIFSCPNNSVTPPVVSTAFLVNFIGLNFGAATSLASFFTSCRDLQNVDIQANTSLITNTSSMFQNCTALTTVPLFNTAKVTNMSTMFQNCYSLTTVPFFNTANVTNMSGMFGICYSVTTVPLFNTANVINMLGMFSQCSSLTTVPLFNTIKVTDMASMFNSCYSLKTVPLFNTAIVTTMASMFNNCFSFTTVPLFNTAIVANMSAMFSFCYPLTTVPLFNTANVTNMSNMFLGCSSLITVPLFNTAIVANMSSMFQNCYALMTVPLFNTVNVTNMSAMFSACSSLSTVPLFNTVIVTTMASMFSSCSSLSTGTLNGTRVSISYASCKLSKIELEKIFDNLGTIVPSAQTLAISSNWGAPTPASLAGTSTLGSTTVTMASTTGLSVGMLVTGTSSPLTTTIAVTLQTTANTITLNNHGLSDGDRVSFATIVTTTGVVINRIYYVIGATTNTFQVANSAGGAALTLTNNGTGTLRYDTEILSINPNVSVTLTRKMTSSGANTLSFRLLKISTALHKGWTISG